MLKDKDICFLAPPLSSRTQAQEAALPVTGTFRHLEGILWRSPEADAGIRHPTAGNNKSPAGVRPSHRDPPEVSLRY